MSRIGKKAVEIPKAVKVTIADGLVTVEGPKGTLRQSFPSSIEVLFDESARSIAVNLREEYAEDRFARAMWGTVRALIQNMVTGVTEGYTKAMEIVGVGWGAQVSGQKMTLKLGFANPVEVMIPQGVSVEVEKQILRLSGVDKQVLGQFAAVLRSKRKPEPYNGKGIKFVGEVIKRKQGKQFGS